MEKEINDFEKVMDFLVLIDGLKSVFRQTNIIGGARFENDAEHSWHISVMAHSLSSFFECQEYKPDVARAVKMLLIHDVVELYAGDTYCYNEAAGADKLERELEAAERIFGTLPDELGNEFMSLWLEFDREETGDAVFASIMDKIQPLILNYNNKGDSWIKNGISRNQVLKRMDIAVNKGPEVLRNYVLNIIEKSVENGWLKNE